MKLLHSILLAAPLLLLAACSEPPADLSETKTHESGNIAFEYPGNWRVTEDSNTQGILNLFVETPGNALVILQSYPAEDAEDFESFCRSFSEFSAAETPLAEVGASKFDKLPDANGFQRMHESFVISLLGEAIPHSRMYCSKDLKEQRIFLIFQVAVEDHKKARPGFELIRKSLRAIE